MKLKPDERAVFNLLTEGQLRITADEIASLTQFSKRHISAIINSLVHKGIPVVAERYKPNNGYYIASNQAELNQGIAQYQQQVMTELKRLASLKSIDLETWRKNLTA